MNAKAVSESLERIASAEDFVAACYTLTEEWEQAPDGFDAVEPILRFIETHPRIDFGAPGPLVHFVENFCDQGYEEKLIESLSRNPVGHSLLMLNRVINGTTNLGERKRLIKIMSTAVTHPRADETARRDGTEYLQRLREIES